MSKKCSICESEINGFGNNPEPVTKNNIPLTVEDRCCDDCNLSVVMPVRLTDWIPGDVSDYKNIKRKTTSGLNHA